MRHLTFQCAVCVRSAAPWSADQFSMTACSGGGAVMRRYSSSASHLNPNIVQRVHRCIDAYYIECVLQCHKVAESATTQQETNIMKTINGFFLQNFSLELTAVFYRRSGSVVAHLTAMKQSRVQNRLFPRSWQTLSVPSVGSLLELHSTKFRPLKDGERYKK
jgi:hypothetical protein